jgi:hypothetical protein
LVVRDGIVRAVVLFRRAELKYSVEKAGNRWAIWWRTKWIQL